MRRLVLLRSLVLSFLYRFHASDALFGEHGRYTSAEIPDARPQDQCFSDDEVGAVVSNAKAEDTLDGKRKNSTDEDYDDDVVSNWIKVPGKGQHLILVPRRSPSKIRLTDDVADRLRQSQYIHNTAADDLMTMPPWESARQEQNEMEMRMQQLSEVLAFQNEKNQSLFGKEDKKGEEQRKEVVRLELQSHPGHYIVPLSKTPNEAGFMMLNQENYIELGIGNQQQDAFKVVLRPAETANQKTTDILGRPIMGRRYILEGSAASDENDDHFLLWVGADIMEGAPVTLMAVSSSSSSVNDLLLADLYNDEHCQFVVHDDGSLSPVSAPHLVVGIAPFPTVRLVARNSPHRLLFRYADRFWSAPTPGNGVPLELLSHPDLAVVPVSSRPFESSGIMTLQRLGIGRKKDALRLYSLDNRRHHHFTLMNKPTRAGSLVLVGMDLLLEPGAPVLLLGYTNLTGSKVSSFLTAMMRTSKNATWIVNEEGSISPLNAPYLALGCEQLDGQADQLVTENQRLLTQVQSSRHHPNSAAVVVHGSEVDGETAFPPEMLRMLHIAVVILFVEGAMHHVVFLCLLLALVVLKSLPWYFWFVGLVRMCFGSSAALLCIGVQIAGVLAKKAFRWWKPKQQQQVQRVEQHR